MGKERFACQECGKTYSFKGSLINHKIRHTGIRFTCDKQGCNKTFASKAVLRKHQRTHMSRTILACDELGCDKTFVTKEGLQKHKIRHTGKRFTCDKQGCNKTFFSNYELISHKLFHTGKGYKCDAAGCDKIFTQMSNLKIHKNKAHPERHTDKDGSEGNIEVKLECSRAESWESSSRSGKHTQIPTERPPNDDLPDPTLYSQIEEQNMQANEILDSFVERPDQCWVGASTLERYPPTHLDSVSRSMQQTEWLPHDRPYDSAASPRINEQFTDCSIWPLQADQSDTECGIFSSRPSDYPAL
ncbi:hypothetical protein F4679DRAFT_595056 [Xylaria curta]|nr:hypothetical protein F4679DRAFT_595056 [Xylaria curta]